MGIEVFITDREKIRKEWNKSEKDFKQDLDIIKNWIKTQKHFPEMPSDNVIEVFLTNCKYSIELTKQSLDMFYTMRDLMPDMYRNIHPLSSIYKEKIHNTFSCTLLPNVTPKSLYRIGIIKFKEVADPEDTDICKAFAHAACNISEVRFQEDLCMGDIYILDMEHLKFGVLNKLTATFIKQGTILMEKVHNNRMKGLHILYPPKFFDVVLSLLKSFLNKKLLNRIYLHHNLEDLFKHIPQELLPIDYGGKEKSIKEFEDLWELKFIEYKDRFDELENMYVNESLRPEKLKNDEILGFHGNFKKIDVD